MIRMEKKNETKLSLPPYYFFIHSRRSRFFSSLILLPNILDVIGAPQLKGGIHGLVPFEFSAQSKRALDDVRRNLRGLLNRARIL